MKATWGVQSCKTAPRGHLVDAEGITHVNMQHIDLTNEVKKKKKKKKKTM